MIDKNEQKNNSENPEDGNSAETPEKTAEDINPQAAGAVETDTEKLLKEKEENQKLYGQLIRLKAEFDNYRRRTEEEKSRKFTLGKEMVLFELIGLIDVFDKAIESADKSSDIKTVIDGIHLLNKEFVSFLKKEGVKLIETKSKKLDTKYHEIVGYEESDDEEDIILKEIQRGYIFQDDVIRPAKAHCIKKDEAPGGIHQSTPRLSFEKLNTSEIYSRRERRWTNKAVETESKT